jgi:ankyrin repeat protein
MTAGDPAALLFLVAQGADINAADDRGLTPLHFASQKGREAKVQALVEQGADATLKDDEGTTAAEIAKTPALREALLAAVTRREDRKKNARGLAEVSAFKQQVPHDLIRGPLADYLDLKPKKAGRKTRARKTKRRLTRRRK